MDTDKFDALGIIGIINIAGFNFLVTITDRTFAGAINSNDNIYEVSGIRFDTFSQEYSSERYPQVATYC